MSITIVPFYSPNSVHRPNVFVTSYTHGVPVVLARAKIYLNSNLVGQIQNSPYLEFGSTYFFKIDVAAVLRTFLAPLSSDKTSLFAPLNLPASYANDDCYCNYFIEVRYYYKDPITNLLVQLPTIDYSSTYEAVISTRQTRDTMDLNNYVMTTAFKRFLTNYPLESAVLMNRTLAKNENLFISCIPYLNNAFEVVTYDSNGAVIDRGLSKIDSPANKSIYTIGIGVPNLRTTVYFSGAVNILDPNIAKYSVVVGDAFWDGAAWIFAGRSSIIGITVTPPCYTTKSIRLHWMNRLGGIDAHTFKVNREFKQDAKSEISKKPDSWGLITPPNRIHNFTSFKTNNTAAYSFEVESEIYNESIGLYLSELLSSPEVYMETEGGYLAVVVADQKTVISKFKEFPTIKLVIEESNSVSLQQY